MAEQIVIKVSGIDFIAELDDSVTGKAIKNKAFLAFAPPPRGRG